MSGTDLQQKSVTLRLVDQVRKDLLAANLAEGEVFMTEEQVSRRYGASRSVTREALGRLRAIGILRSRQRKGLVMGRAEPARVLSQCVPFMAHDPEHIPQLAKLRYVMEMGAVDLAVERAELDQIARMLSLVDEWEACIADGARVREGFEADAAFHGLILEMAGVETVTAIHHVIADFFFATRWRTAEWPEGMAKTHWQHRAIAEAIAARDAEQARAMLRLHIRYLRDDNYWRDEVTRLREADAETP